MRKIIMICMLLILPVLMGGSLEPGSAPSPTMKSLDEVEPRIPIPASDTATGSYVIDKSGSYYLTGNRICNSMGIYVNADNVTIDLMGYSLTGTGNCTNGIRINGRTNVEISNGTITNFNWQGIAEYNGNLAKNHRVINVRTVSNGLKGTGYHGISLPGVGHIVENCTSSNNSGDGINVGTACKLTGNVTHNNAQRGIWATSTASVTGNVCYSNSVYGIYAGSYSLVDKNTCYYNTTANIYTGSNCQLGLNVAP